MVCAYSVISDVNIKILMKYNIFPDFTITARKFKYKHESLWCPYTRIKVSFLLTLRDLSADKRSSDRIFFNLFISPFKASICLWSCKWIFIKSDKSDIYSNQYIQIYNASVILLSWLLVTINNYYVLLNLFLMFHFRRNKCLESTTTIGAL